MELNPLFKLNTNNKCTLVLILILLFSQNIKAQVLGQDKDGFSTILMPSSNLNIDGANNVISFSFIQLDRVFNEEKYNKKFSISKCFNEENIKDCIKEKWDSIEINYKKDNKAFLYGLELKGSSKNGLSIILKDELLSNSALISGVLGFQFINMRNNRKSVDEYIKIKKENADIIDRQEKSNYNIISYVDKMIAESVINKDKADKLLKYKDDILTTSEKINELKSRIEDIDNLNDYESTFNDRRLEEIKKQIDILNYAIKVIDSIPYLEGFPSISKLSNSEKDLSFLKNQSNKVNSTINELNNQYNKYNSVEIKINIEKYLDNETWKSVRKEIEAVVAYLNGNRLQLESLIKNSNQSEYFIKLKSLYEIEMKLLTDYQENKKKNDEVFVNQVDFNRHFFYGKVGYIGKSFLYDLDNGGTTKNARIEKRNFQGNRFEIGWTHQFKFYNFLGLNVSKDYTDNSGLLDSNTYEFKTIDVTVTPNFESSNKFDALSGVYDRFHKYQISGDYVRLFFLKDQSNLNNKATSEVYLSLNPYFRHNFFSKSETLKANTTIGLGMYAFNTNKNSIAGGIFVQAGDIFNVNRNSQVNFTKQVSIGLVFKYALSSFNPLK